MQGENHEKVEIVAGQYVGVNVAVAGSGIDSNSADIEAILHSVRLK